MKTETREKSGNDKKIARRKFNILDTTSCAKPSLIERIINIFPGPYVLKSLIFSGTKRLLMFLSSGTAIEEPDKAVDKFLRPIVAKYGLKPESLISFPGKIPEKWAKLDGQKETMKLEKAKEWAEQIARTVQS